MRFDDELLVRAAIIVRDRELASMPRTEDLPEHIYSDEFNEKLQELFQKYRNGEIKPSVVRMGYPFYIRRGIAAVLIGFLLTCIAAPEAVMAGYKRIIETVKTIVTEYTQWHYSSEGQTKDKFKQAKFGYLTKDLIESDSIISEYRYFIVFKNSEDILYFEQILITEESTWDYMLNTEDTPIEIRYINFYEVKFSLKEGMCRYICIFDNYVIKGQTTLSIDETMKILENISFE